MSKKSVTKEIKKRLADLGPHGVQVKEKNESWKVSFGLKKCRVDAYKNSFPDEESKKEDCPFHVYDKKLRQLSHVTAAPVFFEAYGKGTPRGPAFFHSSTISSIHYVEIYHEKDYKLSILGTRSLNYDVDRQPRLAIIPSFGEAKAWLEKKLGDLGPENRRGSIFDRWPRSSGRIYSLFKDCEFDGAIDVKNDVITLFYPSNFIHLSFVKLITGPRVVLSCNQIYRAFGIVPKYRSPRPITISCYSAIASLILSLTVNPEIDWKKDKIDHEALFYGPLIRLIFSSASSVYRMRGKDGWKNFLSEGRLPFSSQDDIPEWFFEIAEEASRKISMECDFFLDDL